MLGLTPARLADCSSRLECEALPNTNLLYEFGARPAHTLIKPAGCPNEVFRGRMGDANGCWSR